jgi:hypothetical protein
MKLNERDKKYLIQNKYEEEEFRLMELCSNRMTVTLSDGCSLTQMQAIELIGRKNYLIGVAETSIWGCFELEMPDGRKLLFDARIFCENLWKEQVKPEEYRNYHYVRRKPFVSAFRMQCNRYHPRDKRGACG